MTQQVISSGLYGLEDTCAPTPHLIQSANAPNLSFQAFHLLQSILRNTPSTYYIVLHSLHLLCRTTLPALTMPFYQVCGVGVWVAFLRTVGVKVRFFRSPIESFFTSVRNPNSCLLKLYNFCWNFYCNREFLLCTMISTDCCCYKIVDNQTWPWVGVGHFASDSATLRFIR